MPYTPNNDTVYSGALLEFVDEPMILTAPDIMDRYWSVEVADCYTNNVFYIGTRATGGKGGAHAFVGPNWKGTLPAGVVEHRMPNNSAMFAIRIGVLPNDPADLKIVNALQEKFQLTSLSNWGDPSKHGMVTVPKTSCASRLQRRPRVLSDARRPDLLRSATSRARSRRDLLRRGNIDVGKPFDESKLDDAAHKGLARAARGRAGDHEMESKIPRHALSHAVEQSAPRRLRLRLF